MSVITGEEKAARPWALKILPPFPQVAIRLLDLLSQEEVSMKKVAEMVKLDPAFGAEILRLANSAAYGFRSQIDSLSHAIVLLGTDRVKALTMTVAVGAYGKRAFRFEALKQVWRHSLSAAFLSEEIATAAGINRDRAYTAGLLRNIGALGLLVGYPSEYSDLIAVANENLMNLRDVERGMFDIDHREAGRWLAQEWRFPAELQQVIAEEDDAEIPAEFGLGPMVRLAERMADTLGLQFVQPLRTWTYEELLDLMPAAARQAMPEIEVLTGRIQQKVGGLAT